VGWLEKARAAGRAHKYSFLISVLVTALGLGLYIHSYVAESQSPLALFVRSIEAKTYDMRFRVRGRTDPAPEIVIVAIDQATLERLGSWPFPRIHYARMLDRLTADGAAVVGFDINFPRPDTKSGLQAVQQARQAYLEATPSARQDTAYMAELDRMEQLADADAQLAQAIRQAGNVVLGYFFFPSREEVRFVDQKAQEEADGLLSFSSYSTRGVTDAEGNPPPPLAETFRGEEGFLAETNLPRFIDAADFTVGFFNFVADADSVFRRSPLTFAYKGAWQDDAGGQLNFYSSLDVQILRRYWNVPEHEAMLLYNKAGVEAVQLGERRIPTDPEGRMPVHYQGGPFTYPHYSLADVVEGDFAPGTFRDKIVLLGPTALAVGDFGPTPFAESNHSGVEIHANVLDTILNQRFIHHGDREKLIDLSLILIFGLVVGVVLVTVRPAWTAPVALTLLVIFAGVTYWALTGFQVWLNLVLPGSVLAVNFGGVAAFRVLFEEREKRKVRSAFQQYIPPGVISQLMKNPEQLKLGGEERELTVMFSDIRGFTALSERLSPLELTSFLNSYTDEMTDIIFSHWGTLDKFEGDAIMCFWGAPYDQDDHMVRACNAALEMGRRIDELREQWRAEGRPDINIGLGMNTGRVVVGNMGSRKRFNYTVLGDPVNLASRLEGVNKTYATRIIASQFTYEQARDALGILDRRLSRTFGVPLEALSAGNGSPQAERARHVALYLGHELQLAPAATLAERYGSDGPAESEKATAEVERWIERDKKVRRFVQEARRSLRSFCFRPLDWIRVKGKQKPVGIYELLSHAGSENTYAELAAMFEAGLEAYRGQQWEAAREIFESILKKHPDDGPARLFAERCRVFQADPPPPEWDGVFVMKTK
jgi:adenylate cyclase